MESLDNILSAGREAAPSAEKQEPTTPATEQAAELTTEQTTDADGGHTAQGSTAADGKPVPVGAIRQAERDKADKRYTAVLDNLRTEIADRDAAWERRMTKLVETVKPPQPAPPAPDFYENPDAAVDHRIARTVSPEFERIGQTMHYNSHLIASQVHTPEVVKTADEAFRQAYHAGQLDPADAHRVLTSPNIYDAAVRWHQRRQAIEEIGPDPVAYKAKVEAEIRAKLEQPDEQAPAQQRAPVMPSNLAAARNVGSRSGPVWGGASPIQDIFNRHRGAK